MDYAEYKEALEKLRKAGYAVVLFSPKELREMPADVLEYMLVELANEELEHW